MSIKTMQASAAAAAFTPASIGTPASSGEMTSVNRLHLATLVGVYSLASLGSLGLWMGESTAGITPYPILVVVAAVIAFLCTDLWGRLRLPLWTSNILAVIILSVTAVEFARDRNTSVFALAHLLVWLQCAKFFRPKDPQDLWQLLGLSLLQIAIACVINRELKFGLLLMTYAVLGAATLGLFQLRNVASHSRGVPTSAWLVVGLVVRRAVTLALLAVPMAFLLFVFMPRAGAMRVAPTTDDPNNGLRRISTGFSSTVRFNEIGEIMKQDDVVFNVWATDADGVRARLPNDLLWRGAVLVGYHDNEWFDFRAPLPVYIWRQEQKLLPGQVHLRVQRLIAVGHTLFSPKPLYWARPEDLEMDEVHFVGMEGRLFLRRIGRTEDRGFRGPTIYNMIVGVAGDFFRDAAELAPDPEYLRRCKATPTNLARVQRLALSLCEGLDQDDLQGKINRIMDYLQRTGDFVYTLDASREDENADAVEDFLLNMKAGHCEYFASSLAIMLRFVGVPTRLVNGFKGADYNDAGGYYQVRQFLAHSWVEAYMAGEQRWVTLDPTPNAAREEVVAQNRSSYQWFSELTDAANTAWSANVMGYSNAEQSEAVFSIFADFFDALKQAFAGEKEAFHRLMAQMSQFSFWISGRGLLLLAALVALVCLPILIVRLLAKSIRRGRAPVSPLPLYRSWISWLDSHGWRRSPSKTHREFAIELARQWRGRPDLAGYADLPVELADAHYLVRFGAESPLDEQTQEWQRRIMEARMAMSRARSNHPS